MILILDFGVGNVGSIYSMIKRIGYNAVVSGNLDEIKKADKIILPGVGSFDNGMNKLADRHCIEILNKRVLIDKIPIMGICLGMQLMTLGSEEGSKVGLGWINAHVAKFNFNNLSLKIPHMSWNYIEILKLSKLFEGMYENPRFYFAHSYHLLLNNVSDGLTMTNYSYDFISSFEKDNIIGVQFHPEKSHKFGMKLFSNFIENF